MPLNPEQQAAVSYLEGPLLVLAGPGTGKTQLLSAKVAYILEHTDASPSNILCITFTESGASNMRNRLKTMIGQAADELNIYTYHAFGTEVLNYYSNYAEHPDRQLKHVIDDVAQYKLLREIQASLPARDILKTTAISDLRETIQNAKTARLTPADLTKIAEINLQDSQQISQIATANFSHLIPRDKFQNALESTYQPLLEDLIALTSPTPITGSIERTANLIVRELKDLIDEQLASDKPKISPLSQWRTRRFERDAAGDYRLKDYIANKKLLSLARIMSEYDQQLHAGGQYDFADMIEEAISALRSDQGFRLTLSEQFQYILLDEFQDTNPSQFELIRLLTDYEKPQVMAVGDDDQAIFAFQGANASNLIDFRDHYNAHVITLVDNYRSTGAILDFSHRIADQLNESFAKKYQINKTLRSMQDLWHPVTDHTDSSQTPAISRHEFLSASDEYYWLAEQVRQLIDRGIPGPEIAIIAPKHKYIAPILPYLRNQHLSLAYEKSSDLLEDPALRQLITLAEFIYELSQQRTPSHLLLEILTYPFLGIKPTEALSIFDGTRYNHRAPLEYLQSSNHPELVRLAQWFADLVAASYDTPLDLWLSYLIGQTALGDFTSPFLTYYADHSSEVALVELYQNLNTLRQTVQNHLSALQPDSDHSLLTLKDFVATIEDYRAAAAPIKHTSLYEEGSNAVQVMSAHKSKGLEFQYVFLIAVDELAWGRAKGNNNLFSLPNNLISIRHTGATDDERLRLLFVAVTRAKQHLIMTNSVEDFAGKTPDRLSFLREVRTESAPQVSPLLPEHEQDIAIHRAPDATHQLAAIERSWTAAFREPDPDLRQLFRRRLEHYRLTATDLTAFIDLINSGPEKIYRQRLLQAPNDPLNLNLAYGNLIHSTFERITREGISDELAMADFQEQTKSQPLLNAEIQELQERGAHDLPIALNSFREILRAPNARAEVSFPGERLTAAGIPIQGQIDHINIDPEAKTIELYDFKTGKYHPEKWSSHPTLYLHSLQLGFYKLLLNASREYHDYQVTRGHILFVVPDPTDSLVHDKVFDFTPQTESELLDLAYAVYQEIISLDFLDNPDVFIHANKNHTMRRLRAFIDTLISLQPRPQP